jgi:hypothetical protein
MTEPDILASTLRTYADRAAPVRPNLIALVEHGYRRRRRRQVIGSMAAALVVAAIVTAGAAVNPFSGTAGPAPQPATSIVVPTSPLPTVTPSPTASSSSGPGLTGSRASAAPTPLACPTTNGTPQTPKQVLALLKAASRVNEYAAANIDPMTLDSRLGGKLPDVHIPLAMLKAIAADESSWTSTCVSADGYGYGTMQVGADATTLVNSRFLTTFDRFDQANNILLANAYLEYLAVHFGILYFHNDFDLTTNTSLRDTVIAAYNVGITGVDPTGTKIDIGPIGHAFVGTIVALMNPAEPCQKTWGR